MSLSKGEIALSVGGTVAGLVLTYLLWRMSEKDSAANAAAAAAAQANATQQAATDQQNMQMQLASLPSVSVPSLTMVATDTSSADAPASVSESTTVSNLLSSALSSGASTAAPVMATISAIPTSTSHFTGSSDTDFSKLTSVTGIGSDLTDAAAASAISQLGNAQYASTIPATSRPVSPTLKAGTAK